MNLYAYVGNDPINMTDPTGEFGLAGAGAGALAGGFVGATFGALGEVGSQLAAGEDVNWQAVGVSALAGGAQGAIVGAVYGSGAGVLAVTVTAVTVGAPVAGLEEVVNAEIKGESTSAGQVVTSMALGAAGGLVPGGSSAAGQLDDAALEIVLDVSRDTAIGEVIGNTVDNVVDEFQ